MVDFNSPVRMPSTGGLYTGLSGMSGYSTGYGYNTGQGYGRSRFNSPSPAYPVVPMSAMSAMSATPFNGSSLMTLSAGTSMQETNV